MHKPEVLIIDDNTLFLDWGVSCLENVASVQTCSKIKEALSIFRRHQIDVVIVDITLANGENGIDLVQELRKYYEFLLIFISGNHYSVFEETLPFNPDANLAKPVTEFQLLTTFNTVWKSNKKQSSVLEDELTKREKEILKMYCKGNSTSDISDFLSLSPHTVQRVRKNLLKKFEVHSIQDLLRKAYELGIVRN